MTTVKFTRVGRGRGTGLWTTTVKGVEFNVAGPDPLDKPEPGFEWTAETAEQGVGSFFARTREELRRELQKWADSAPVG